MKRILIAIPSGDDMAVEFVQSLLALRPVDEVEIKIHAGSLVYIAREFLAAYATEQAFDYVLWLDTDMVFNPDLLEKLIEDDVDMVAGLFFQRRPPCYPAIWSKIIVGEIGEREDHRYLDYPKNELFEIDACGMAAVLVKGKVIKKIWETYGRTFEPISGYGEDISFCIRARNCGFKIWCDSRIPVGHRGHIIVDDATYNAFRRLNPANASDVQPESEDEKDA